MARKTRIHVPGGLYHVMLRGNGGQDVFFSPRDRYRLYLLLQEGVSRFGYRVHAFCFMTNHIHLALQAGEIPLSKGMQNLSFRYTRWINTHQNHSGHLFQGRYKALLVDGDSYLLELVRYIHTNPVRAGLAPSVCAYPWSSHRAYLGREVFPWLTADWVLGQFDGVRGRARRLYEGFMQDDLEREQKSFLRGDDDPRIIGDDRFLEQAGAYAEALPRRRPPLEDIVAAVCCAYDMEDSALKSPWQGRAASEARAMVGWFARALGSATLTDVGKLCNRDVGTMSSAIRRLSERAASNPDLRERMEGLRARLLDEVGNLEA